MATIAQTLVIAGAAEGSFYTSHGKLIDVRYQGSFANEKSGMSFGVFQFDAHTNSTAKSVLHDILNFAVNTKAIDATTSKRLEQAATKKNAGAYLKGADRTTMDSLLSSPTGKTSIDVADTNRATDMESWVDGMIAQAATVWSMKKITAPILTPGGKNNLRLFAYLLANLNRYPDDEDVFQDWLNGKVVKTKNGPPKGWQLTAPPTLDQMHKFFHSLVIWDGTQGKYQNLRDRLDPTLDALGA